MKNSVKIVHVLRKINRKNLSEPNEVGAVNSTINEKKAHFETLGFTEHISDVERDVQQ